MSNVERAITDLVEDMIQSNVREELEQCSIGTDQIEYLEDKVVYFMENNPDRY